MSWVGSEVSKHELWRSVIVTFLLWKKCHDQHHLTERKVQLGLWFQRVRVNKDEHNLASGRWHGSWSWKPQVHILNLKQEAQKVILKWCSLLETLKPTPRDTLSPAIAAPPKPTQTTAPTRDQVLKKLDLRGTLSFRSPWEDFRSRSEYSTAVE